jgi:hypothetical protein
VNRVLPLQLSQDVMTYLLVGYAIMSDDLHLQMFGVSLQRVVKVGLLVDKWNDLLRSLSRDRAERHDLPWLSHFQ